MMNDMKNSEYREGYKQGKEEQAKITAEIEYELSAKCNSLADEISVLKEKCQYWQMRCDELDGERHLLQAQLDVVKLIFGGRQ